MEYGTTEFEGGGGQNTKYCTRTVIIEQIIRMQLRIKEESKRKQYLRRVKQCQKGHEICTPSFLLN